MEVPEVERPAEGDSCPFHRVTDGLPGHVGPYGVKPRPLVDSEGRPHLFHALEAIEARWGSVEAYLDQRLGVGPQEIERLRALYLA